MIILQDIINIIAICSLIYPCIKIYKLYKNVKKGNKEKHIVLKVICYSLFYEPFIIYDIIKFGFKSTNKNLIFGDKK